jgi:hypothetical protein
MDRTNWTRAKQPRLHPPSEGWIAARPMPIGRLGRCGSRAWDITPWGRPQHRCSVRPVWIRIRSDPQHPIWVHISTPRVEILRGDCRPECRPVLAGLLGRTEGCYCTLSMAAQPAGDRTLPGCMHMVEITQPASGDAAITLLVSHRLCCETAFWCRGPFSSSCRRPAACQSLLARKLCRR